MNSLRPRTLTEYLRALSRRKLATIIPALVIIIASAIAIYRLPDIYESSTFIIIDSPANQGSPDTPDLARRLSAIRQQVTSRTRLESVIAKYALYQEEIADGASLDDVIEDMRQAVRVEVNSGRDNVTDAFAISYRATSPDVAQKVTAELVSQLLTDNVAAMKSQISGEADVLRQKAADLSARLQELEKQSPWLLALKEDAPAAPATTAPRSSGPSPEAVRAQQMNIESLKDQEYKLQQQIAEVERRIKELTPIVEQQKNSSGLRDNPTYAALIARRAELQGQRNNLLNRQELTEKHPRVIEISDQIAAIDRQVSELQKQVEGSIRQTPELSEMRSLQSERNRLKVELEVTGREIKRREETPLVAASASRPADPPPNPASRDETSARLAQDYLGLKQEREEVSAKLRDAELKGQTLASEKAEQFRVLDQANLPQSPSSPNRGLLSAVAVAFALVVGVSFAFALEVRRFAALQDAKDVEHYTRLPLLAAIPRTVTEEEQNRSRKRARLRTAIGAVVAVTATVALTEALILTDLFALISNK